ncbi:MAG: T9SS type A sorting domain-containing protein [Bacteroidia bacterium]|nr:T9SS type A sorting domain-containing protein [Bacteroidia bacterium]
MRRHATLLFFALLLCAAAMPAVAQAPFTALNTAYTQNFNTLNTSGSVSWVNNSTITAWHHARTGTGDLIVAGNGSSNSGALYSFGTGTDADRALGSVGSGNAAVGNLWWGVHFINNTGTTITALDISYYGEQWRYSGTAAAQVVTFSYQTGTGLNSLTTGTWTNAASFDFTSPIISGTTGALDGNASANRVLISGTLAVTLAPGQEIMLRWYDPDHSGSDHGLAIDDFSATPLGSSGPTSVAFFLGSSTASEGAGVVNVELLITNPDATNATQATVALTGGTAVNGSDVLPAYTTQTVTFPAGSNANQSISFTLFDDTNYEGNETLEFTITGVTGGNSASVGAQAMHTLTILENDPPPMPAVIVNEAFNAYGHIGTDEAVELYVVQDGADLRGYSLADATSGGTYPYGVLTFSTDALWSNLPAGTIIVIGGMFAVPIPDTDVSDGLLLLQAPVNNASNQYFSYSSNQLSFAGSSDAIAIRDAGGNFVHGLAYGANNQNTLPTGRHGWRSGSVASVESITFSRSGAPMVYTDFLIDTYVVAAAPSLGNPSDADGNRAYLRTLRSRTITANRSISGTFFWDVTVNNNAILTLAGPTNVGNILLIADGRLNESGQGLSTNGNGNAQNGSGAGNLTVGDGVNIAAVLALLQNPTLISGTFNATASDATVEYPGTAAQNIFNAVYNNLKLLNGGQSTPKTVSGAVTVNGQLSIGTGVWLVVNTPNIITLGPVGTFTNQGRFIGKIRSTRNFPGGVENFGGIGITLSGTPPPAGPQTFAAVPGTVTVTMSSGSYIWVDNRPSILRQYTIEDSNPNSMNVTMTVHYAQDDLNGQVEPALNLFKSTNNGSSWNNRSATLNTTANTLVLDLADINGLWTMHANPPQGMIDATPATLSYETEQDGPLPASQNIAVSNAYGNGSIIEWTATSSTIEAPTWLAIIPSPATGVNAGQFSVQVTRSNLVPGTYTGTITITDIHAVNSPVTIPVFYRVYKPRMISIGVDTLRIKLTYKKPKVSTSIPVVNGGEAFGPGVIAWNATTTTPWLQITSGSGLEGDWLGLTIDAHLFPSGTYTGLLTITGVNSVTNDPIKNSPLNVVVVLEVEPWDAVVHSRSSLPMGSSTTFYNSEGHRVAKIDVTSGSIQSLTIRMNPFSLPRNIQRLRYAFRHYIVEATGTYTANMTMWYTLSELVQTGITEPWRLRPWLQRPALFTWVPIAGSANHVEQSVTTAALIDLNGIWGMAYPFVMPEIINVHSVDARWIDPSTAGIAWSTDADISELGFIIERSPLGKDEWLTAGVVDRNDNGSYQFIDNCGSSTSGWQYRLLAFDETGSARQSDPVELQPMGILTAEGLAAQGFSMSQNIPNPVSSRSGHTTISFNLPRASEISLRVFDMLGREIETGITGRFDAGVHSVTLNFGVLQPGTYMYQLRSAEGVITKKMLIVR